MSLYKQWVDLMEGQTDETFEAFWEEYSSTETRIYEHILAHKDEHLKGKFSDLVEQFKADPVIFMGFLDGINESIETKQELEGFDEESEIELKIVPETLFYNMLKADADYLYGLEQWMDILGEDKIREIVKEYKASKTVRRAAPKIGRNDPCPCGSGKKYKHCCGRN